VFTIVALSPPCLVPGKVTFVVIVCLLQALLPLQSAEGKQTGGCRDMAWLVGTAEGGCVSARMKRFLINQREGEGEVGDKRTKAWQAQQGVGGDERRRIKHRHACMQEAGLAVFCSWGGKIIAGERREQRRSGNTKTLSSVGLGPRQTRRAAGSSASTGVQVGPQEAWP